jgi:hypothetical protein
MAMACWPLLRLRREHGWPSRNSAPGWLRINDLASGHTSGREEKQQNSGFSQLLVVAIQLYVGIHLTQVTPTGCSFASVFRTIDA